MAGPDHARIGRIHQQLEVAAGRLRHRVVAGTRSRGPGRAEAADRAVDQARIELAQLLLADAQLLRHAGPEVLDVHVGRLHQLVQALAVGRLLGVERDAALVAVVGLEVRAVEAALEGAERVARAGLLDLDHVRAQVAQQHAAGRAGDEGALLEHAHVLQHFDHLAVSAGGLAFVHQFARGLVGQREAARVDGFLRTGARSGPPCARGWARRAARAAGSWCPAARRGWRPRRSGAGPCRRCRGSPSRPLRRSR